MTLLQTGARLTFSCLLIGLLSRQALATAQGYLCYNYINSNDKFYNLNGLQTSDQAKYTIQSLQIKTPNEGNTQANIIFNICGTKTNTGIANCDGSVSPMGFVQVDGGSCYPLSKNTGDQVTSWAYSALDSANSSNDGIIITGTNSDTATAPFNVALQLKCDSGVTGDPTLSAVYVTSSNLVQISVTHKDACGVEFLGPFSFLTNYKWPILFIGLVLGCTLCFFGFRVFKYSLAILGFLIGYALGDLDSWSLTSPSVWLGRMFKTTTRYT